MSQNDFSTANQPGASFRADVNSALQALASLSAGATEPGTTYANQLWYDTANALLKQRDPSNASWKTIAAWNGSNWIPYRAGVALGTASIVDTGTAEGNVPLLQAGGLLAAGRLPAVVGDSGAGGTKGAVPAPAAGDAAAGKFLKADGTWAASANAFLHYQEVRASNTAGPAYTAGGWRTVAFNTEVADSGDNGALSSNQITIEAGTYLIWAQISLGVVTGQIRLRWHNVTDGATVLQSTQGLSNPAATTIASYVVLMGSFTIAAQKVFEVQVYPTVSNNNSAMNTGDSEIYSNLLLQRIAA